MHENDLELEGIHARLSTTSTIVFKYIDARDTSHHRVRVGGEDGGGECGKGGK